jgi:hypothetical protein
MKSQSIRLLNPLNLRSPFPSICSIQYPASKIQHLAKKSPGIIAGASNKPIDLLNIILDKLSVRCYNGLFANA